MPCLASVHPTACCSVHIPCRAGTAALNIMCTPSPAFSETHFVIGQVRVRAGEGMLWLGLGLGLG